MSVRTVLFVCVANSGRSLLAEAIFNADPPPGWQATSAGTRPASAANPRTGAGLREIGLALPAHPPQALTTELMEGSSVRVTMGCLDDASCPARLKALALRDWALPFPAQGSDQMFREVWDEIRRRVAVLRTELVARDATGTASDGARA